MTSKPRDPAAAIYSWALAPQSPPPLFAPETLAALASPNATRSEAIGRLLVLTCAKLGLGRCASEGFGPLATGASAIAAAVAFRQVPPLATKLVELAPPPRSLADHLLRMAVVQATIEWIENTALRDLLREAAPLAAALSAPVLHCQDQAMDCVLDMAVLPQARFAFTCIFSAPGERSAIRRWRGTVMDRARLYCPDGEALVLDIYETAMVDKGAELHATTVAAQLTLLHAAQASNDQIEDALALAAWWQPLATLGKFDLDLFRDRPGLFPSIYRAGFRLAGMRKANGAAFFM